MPSLRDSERRGYPVPGTYAPGYELAPATGLGFDPHTRGACATGTGSRPSRDSFARLCGLALAGAAFALLQQFRDRSQRFIHRGCCREFCGDVWVQNNDIRACRIPARVLATDTLAEIVLATHAIAVALTFGL